jgi:Ca2+-binding EF-hand superfamily protein
VQFYANGEQVEAFPCGPRKIELLREKLEKWQHWCRTRGVVVEDPLPDSKQNDPVAGEVRDFDATVVDSRRKREIASEKGVSPTATEQTALYSAPKSDNPVESIAAEADLIAAHSIMKRVPLLSQLEEVQLDAILNEGRVATYEAGDVLISEGDIGRRFFVLLDGECDVFQLANLASSSRMPGFSPDPTRTAFGGRTNTLVAGAYFGERALVTNEPRAASIVAATDAIALIVDRSALAKVDRKVWGEDATFESLADLLESSSGGVLWGYERREPGASQHAESTLDSDEIHENDPVPSDVKNDSPKVNSGYFENTASPLPVMQRLRLVRSVIRAFDQASARSPRWGDAAEIAYRKDLVAQLTSYQRQEFEQTFKLLDRDGDGSISVTDLAALMIAVGRHPDAVELSNMINKANPEVEGNKNLKLEDFLALLAQAEFSAMFLEAFKLLDPAGHGWVESELLWQMMNALIPSAAVEGKTAIPEFFGGKLDELVDTFGVSDGHIDYQAFVKIMMTKQR